jgi:hypothetical protein
MKKTIFSLCTVIFLAAVRIEAQAGSRAPSNLGREYLVSVNSLSAWSFGGYVDVGEKTLTLDRPHQNVDLACTKYMTYLGYDVFSWLTPYLVAGTSQSKFSGGYWDEMADSSAQYGIGIQANLIDHEVADPTLMEDRVRLNAAVEYSVTQADYAGQALDWVDFDASLTLAIVNDVAGNILFVPESIAFFGGPIFSTWSSHDFKPAQNRDELGFTVGMEVFYTTSVSLNIRANMLDHTGMTAGLNIRF